MLACIYITESGDRYLEPVELNIKLLLVFIGAVSERKLDVNLLASEVENELYSGSWDWCDCFHYHHSFLSMHESKVNQASC